MANERMPARPDDGAGPPEVGDGTGGSSTVSGPTPAPWSGPTVPPGPVAPPGATLPPETGLPAAAVLPTGVEAPPGPTFPVEPRRTRASAAWFATISAIVLLALLVVFILQNPDDVEVRFLGLQGSVPLGVALLIAALAGAAVVVIVGVVRMTQLRRSARRASRASRDGRPARRGRERGP